VYSVYVRQKKDASTQIFSLDYADRLRIFDARGTLRSTRKWSSKVRCIAVADVRGEGKDSLVGGVGRKLLVVDHRGKAFWRISLESPVVACDARDVDGDGAAEVVVALQNRRVVLWNDDKDAIFSRNMRNPVADVWLEDITNDSELETVIADRSGLVTVLTSAGYQLQEIQLGENIRTFAVLSFGEKKLFVTGDNSSVLRLWELDGSESTKVNVEEAPRALATGIPDDDSDTAYLVVSTRDKRLTFFEVEGSGRISKSEKVILQQLGSTKTILYRRAIKCGNCGAPVSPEADRCESCGAKLEMFEEYVIEEYIQESIDSITSKHDRIQLNELDRILRRTLPRPAAYNLRRSLQAMIQSGAIEGYIQDNTFVRTHARLPRGVKKPKADAIKRVPQAITGLLRKEDSFAVAKLERETGVDREILRRTLIILLGEGDVKGTLDGEEFRVDEGQDVDAFVRKMVEELRNWNG
jgi:hypothetical protein